MARLSDEGWVLDLGWLDQMDGAMKTGMLDLCEETAEAAVKIAASLAPNTSRSRGYSLGALAASGYMISMRRSTYLQHIKQARSIPGTKIVMRGQILGRFPMESLDVRNPNKAFAVMDFPLSYASLIRTGFHHRKAKRFIIGVDFIQSAENKIYPKWESGQRKLIRNVEKLAR